VICDVLGSILGSCIEPGCVFVLLSVDFNGVVVAETLPTANGSVGRGLEVLLNKIDERKC
jgi:hypothetical protein